MQAGRTRLLTWGIVVLVVSGGIASWYYLAGRGPENRLVRHLEAMVELLEQHKEAPDQAAVAVEEYVAGHRDELVALRGELEQRRAALPAREVADLAAELLRKSGPVMERAHRLMREHPGLAGNERLRKALESLSP